MDYHPNPLQTNAAYSVVKLSFIKLAQEEHTFDVQVPDRRYSFSSHPYYRIGGKAKVEVYFEPDEVHACIVTCGGLCPGLNTVIREIVCGLNYMYGVNRILGIELSVSITSMFRECSWQGGFRGFYARNTVNLTPKFVNDIHKRGGTILGTSRGGHDTSKIVDSIQDRGINQVYIIGGDGTQKGASAIFEEIKRRGLKVVVAGIPKTIDNDIAVIDKSFGFDTAVEEAQRAINAAHVEAESVENGVGVVKLMGRYSGFIAMYATLASRDVDCCLIPESPFFLEGKGGLFEFMEKRLKDNGHMVIVLAEGAGQELVAESMRSVDKEDASGNKLLLDVGLWLSEQIKNGLADPTYMIRAVPSNASDNVCCTLLAQSAVHGAMAGYTGFTVGLRVTEKRNHVVITDRMWARLLSSTNQPSFLSSKDILEEKHEGQQTHLSEGDNCLDNGDDKLVAGEINKM
ncbi:ATP-dependent 6-phosphofructokinase 3 [Asimina triloba]